MLPHGNLLAEDLVWWKSAEDASERTNIVERYLPNPLHVLPPENAECFDRNSLVVVNAFPNVAETPMGHRVLARFNELIGYDMGIRQQTRSTAKLPKLLEYPYIVLRDCKGLFHKAMKMPT